MKRMLTLFLIIFPFLSACTGNPGRPFYKTKEGIDYVGLNVSHQLVQRNAKATISNWFYLYVPIRLEIGMETNVTDKLSDMMLKQYKGDVLTNVEVEKYTMYSMFWNIHSYSMTADVWKEK